MSLKHGILGLLSHKPMAGYDLMKVFNQSLKFFWPAQASQIYRELDALAESGLIHTEEEQQRGRQVKTIYSLTQAGKTELATWLESPGIERSSTRSPFLLRLFFQAGNGKESIRSLLQKRLEQTKANAEELRVVLSDVIPEYRDSVGNKLESVCWSQTVTYGLAHYEAEIQWAEAFLTRLNTLEGEIE